MSVSDKAVDAAAKALTDEGGGPGYSIHSWRCDHPDRFGECDCVRETARIMLAAAAPFIGAAPDLCHNGHRFEPGEDTDMVAEGRRPDPRWCNVCGEARANATDGTERSPATNLDRGAEEPK